MKTLVEGNTEDGWVGVTGLSLILFSQKGAMNCSSMLHCLFPLFVLLRVQRWSGLLRMTKDGGKEIIL